MGMEVIIVKIHADLCTLTQPRPYGLVILSEAKNLSLCGRLETLRFAQGDKGEVLLESFSNL